VNALTRAPEGSKMTKYLAGVLSVIAVGVLLVAYGLLSPRATALSYQNQNPYGVQTAFGYGAQPAFNPNATVPCACANGMQVAYPYGANPYMPNNGFVTTPVVAQRVQAIETVQTAPVRRTVRTVERAPRRDWKKTAMVIGGSTATAAGIGGLVGGKKGALVGAALGGGISTIYETTRNRNGGR
jgi:hypothetical protein